MRRGLDGKRPCVEPNKHHGIQKRSEQFIECEEISKKIELGNLCGKPEDRGVSQCTVIM